jgi:guanylate kinase
MRPGDRDGVDYHFVTIEKFHQMQDAGEFLETATVHGHFYGTPKKSVMDALRHGADVVLVIDVQGRERLMRYDFGKELPQICSIFIRPETTEQLRKQLQGRGDSLDVIARRVPVAEKEIARAGEYDYVVTSYAGQPHLTLAHVMEIFEGVA